MQKKHLQTLELDRVLQRLAELCVCEDAARLALALEPTSLLKDAALLQQETLAAMQETVRHGYPSLAPMKNCELSVKRAVMGGALSLSELLEILTVLRTIHSLQRWWKALDAPTALDAYFGCLYPNGTLEERLSLSIRSPEELEDNASPELADIRRKIRAAQQRIRSQLDAMIRSATYQKYLQDPIVTLRNGRFVVPVKTEYRSEVRGLVHDTSSSGATVFIEPAGAVEANNEIRLLEGKEQREIERIIAELSAMVADSSESLLSSYRAAVSLDLIFAKSRLADRMRAAPPLLTEDGVTRLKKARHPLIDPGKVVPIDIALGEEWDTLVITGPNTGGKTVALKTLGLLTLMAACGLMLPTADGSQVSLYDEVLADIGDEQSIEQNLSTFSSHMTNIISILENASRRSLILLDELGAGTDPTEGAALAIAVLEYTLALGAKTAATTHYAELKLYALSTQRVENASCEFDVATLRPTFRLLTGIPGRSNAFLIGERLGLPARIIQRGRALVSGESMRFEQVVTELEEARQQMERDAAAARRQRAEAEKLLREAEAAAQRQSRENERETQRARVEANRMLADVRVRSEKLIDELEQLKHERDKEEFSRLAAQARSGYRGALRELERMTDPVREALLAEEAPVRPIKQGDIVTVLSLGARGTVLSDPDASGEVQVQAGLLKLSAKLSDLRLEDVPRVTLEGKRIRPAAPRAAKPAATSGSGGARRENLLELDLRGEDSIQAVALLDSFLDSAAMSGLKSLRIIHGKGTGVLRSAVQSHLRRHPLVDSYRLGVFGEGESGVTIVELK